MRGLVAGGVMVATAAAASPLPAVGTFVYSDACESAGGDFEGHRVTLTIGGQAPPVVVEFNDDGADGRDTPQDFSFDANTGALRFTFHGNTADYHIFQGRVSRESLEGKFDARAAKLPSVGKAGPLPDCPK